MVRKRAEEFTERHLVQYFKEFQAELAPLARKRPPATRSRCGGPTTVFSVRLAPDELRLLRAAAGSQGRTVSDVVRGAALASVQPRRDNTAAVAGLLTELRHTLERLEDALDPEAGEQRQTPA